MLARRARGAVGAGSAALSPPPPAAVGGHACQRVQAARRQSANNGERGAGGGIAEAGRYFGRSCMRQFVSVLSAVVAS